MEKLNMWLLANIIIMFIIVIFAVDYDNKWFPYVMGGIHGFVYGCIAAYQGIWWIFG